MLEPRPNSVSLASSMAAANDGTRNRAATGPNTSSAYILMSVVIPASSVGG